MLTARRLQFDVKRNAWANTSSALNEERRKGAEGLSIALGIFGNGPWPCSLLRVNGQAVTACRRLVPELVSVGLLEVSSGTYSLALLFLWAKP